MLTCQELTELVTDYVEKRMPLWERIRFQMHLGMCRHCRSYVRQMRKTILLLGRLPEESIPEHAKNELLARFRSLRPPEG